MNLYFPFQWAPTLGGECYYELSRQEVKALYGFQWAPTLGGECYSTRRSAGRSTRRCFNGHPPLGVNATDPDTRR